MNKTATIITRLHFISLTIFIVIDEILEVVFYPWLEQTLNLVWLSIGLNAVFSGTLYTIVYFAAHGVYVLLKFRIKSPQMNIGGKWYHVHIPMRRDEESGEDIIIWRDYARAGETEIKQNLYDLYFTAENVKVTLVGDGLHWAASDRNKTRWSYKSVEFGEQTLDGIKIYACYSATSRNTRTDGEGGTVDAMRLGVHDLKIVREGKIEGEYLDTYPSANKGEIHFFRSREERDEFILQFLNKEL